MGVLSPESNESAWYIACKDSAGCSFNWSRRPDPPPHPPLPTCLPLGGRPIAFASGYKPPCCNKSAMLIPTDEPPATLDGYPESNMMYGLCLSSGMRCEDRIHDCCDGLKCVDTDPNWHLTAECLDPGTNQQRVTLFM